MRQSCLPLCHRETLYLATRLGCMRLTEQIHQNPSASPYPGEILLSPLQFQAIHEPERIKI